MSPSRQSLPCQPIETRQANLVAYDRTVEPAEDISLEGFTSCPAFTAHTSEVYASDAFKAKAAEQKDFLQSLVPYLDGRNVSLSNMYNIFDYMNVNDIHDAGFRTQLNSSGQHDYIMVRLFRCIERRYLAERKRIVLHSQTCDT
jgi:hypothetical protein